MSERRPLLHGLKPATELDRGIEEQFVFQAKTKIDQPAVPSETVRNKPTVNAPRVPLTTRVRGDIAHALKRASLERQLNGIEPYAVQEILEAALEPWLKENGYLN